MFEMTKFSGVFFHETAKIRDNKYIIAKVNDKFLDRLDSQDIFLLDNNGKVFKAISMKITESCYPYEISTESLIRTIKETQKFLRCD